MKNWVRDFNSDLFTQIRIVDTLGQLACQKVARQQKAENFGNFAELFLLPELFYPSNFVWSRYFPRRCHYRYQGDFQRSSSWLIYKLTTSKTCCLPKAASQIILNIFWRGLDKVNLYSDWWIMNNRIIRDRRVCKKTWKISRKDSFLQIRV